MRKARHGLPSTMGHTGRTLLLWLLLSSSTAAVWAAPRRPAEHVVQPGQTLAKIAKRYQLTLEELCDANDLKRSATLKLGQRLTLPNGDDDAPLARSQPRTSAERSPATVGRGSGTTQKVGQLRNASFSRYLGRPVKRGYVHVLGFHGEYKGQLVGKSGKLQEKAVLGLSKVLAWPRTDFVMDRRLLTLLAKTSDAFGGRTLRLVSGYRTSSYASESKHPLGRACDFSVLGVPNSALRDYVRTYNDVGVGYYPNSSFVHLDVREYDATWVDYAGPGEAPRYRNAVAKKHVPNSETDATERDEVSPPPATARNATAETVGSRGDDVEAQADAANDTSDVRAHATNASKPSDTTGQAAVRPEPMKPEPAPQPAAAAGTETL